MTDSTRTGGPAADERLDIYLIAIGGTGMAPIACLLSEVGHRVRGSDGPLYPPMSTLLEEAGIEPLEGYDPAHLEPAPDLVIVGNAVPRTNPEVLRTEELDLPRLSMPQALAHFFLTDRDPLVIAGTHGKTTTTSIAAWVYTRLDHDPGYLIGGVPRDLGRSFARGSGRRFIVEGDEYNAAYFDRGPKFLHYRPQTLVLTSAEYDHADLYPDPDSLLEAYRLLVELIPDDGLLVACGDHPAVRSVAGHAGCEVVFYGLGDDNDVAPSSPIEQTESGCRFVVDDPQVGPVEISLMLGGRHNVANALAVWAVGRRDGLPAAELTSALAEFRGVRRRMEEIGDAEGITVVDDFAHHPTAVGETALALRERYPGRRLVIAFEPRSLTAGRSFLHEAYVEALGRADLVVLAPIFHAARLAPAERLDVDRLVADLAAGGVDVATPGDLEAVLAETVERLRPGDVVVTMSSGEFGGMAQRIVASLVEAEAARPR
ncbi:MAG: Mur ligase family protein [Thermoanaerobaculia bacterium]|nr:Mur ligase family protein [Thermoanaerobaculia bacterium]